MDRTLENIQYLTCKGSNKAMQMYYMWEYEKIKYKKTYGEYPNEKEMYGKTYRNVVESEVKAIMNTINTSNVGQTNAFVIKKWNTDKKDILDFRKSVSNYKLNMPIYLKNSSYKIIQNDSGYEINCAMFNKSQSLKHLTFTIDKLDGNKKVILNQLSESCNSTDLINVVYKKGSMQILKKKNKWCMLISFGFEATKRKLDPNRIVGVDAGIVNALTLQIWDNTTQKWDRLSWRDCVLDGKELIHYRQKVVARRLQLLRNSKLSQENTGKAGHGRVKRLGSINTMSDKVKNFRDTLNHKYSKYVIDFAIRNNCGCIQMEDLSGYTKSVSETFLKNWSYYDLQEKIRYKAEENSIKINFINPRYTSLRCSECGCIEIENRDCKNKQSKFKCVFCGHEENADINAAKNNSLPNIELIIEAQLKVKETKKLNK